MRETDTFDGFVDLGTHVAARMLRASPTFVVGYGGKYELSRDFVLDRPSLEARVANLEAGGFDASESRKALAAWPAGRG